MKELKEKNKESVSSILPVSAIVLLFSITVVPIGSGILTVFLFGTLFLMAGMSLFTMGAETAMQPLGEAIGVRLSKGKYPALTMAACFLLGVIVTVAEPDLQVLAAQIPAVPNLTLIMAVAVGVGIFLLIALLRMLFRLKLSVLLLLFYPVVMVISAFAPPGFVPAAFDSGGVTTGPITVPFILALGTGMASVIGDTRTGESGFGLISLCSIGPILSVLLVSILFRPAASVQETVICEAATTGEAFGMLLGALPEYGKEVFAALCPIFLVFVLSLALTERIPPNRMVRMTVGMLYTYLGLVLFLTGANVGFMPVGQLLGAGIAAGRSRWLLVPAGMLIGYFVVAAEPAVHVLKKQVEEISNGAITQKAVGLALAVGVSASVGLSMLRVLTGIPLMPFLIIGYGGALAISLFVPGLYTGVAFDSGGVASGPMTTTFLLPFAVGACGALGGNSMTDAFGIVAMVAMTPLITIQVLGLHSRVRDRRMRRRVTAEFERIEDCIVYFEEEEAS